MPKRQKNSETGASMRQKVAKEAINKREDGEQDEGYKMRNFIVKGVAAPSIVGKMGCPLKLSKGGRGKKGETAPRKEKA